MVSIEYKTWASSTKPECNWVVSDSMLTMCAKHLKSFDMFDVFQIVFPDSNGTPEMGPNNVTSDSIPTDETSVLFYRSATTATQRKSRVVLCSTCYWWKSDSLSLNKPQKRCIFNSSIIALIRSMGKNSSGLHNCDVCFWPDFVLQEKGVSRRVPILQQLQTSSVTSYSVDSLNATLMFSNGCDCNGYISWVIHTKHISMCAHDSYIDVHGTLMKSRFHHLNPLKSSSWCLISKRSHEFRS
jgi:hypothetical protein